jgi:hypothetical protein
VTNQATDEISVALLLIPAIQKRILVVRDRQVMLDEDLAELYGVETRRLIEQVKRNIERFPQDFMFQLTKEEAAILRSQFATSSDHGGRRYAPYVFTEHTSSLPVPPARRCSVAATHPEPTWRRNGPSRPTTGQHGTSG